MKSTEKHQSLPDKSIDLILCDLPYGTTNNDWDSVIDLDLLWKQYERIVKDNGAIVLTSQGVFTAELIMSNKKLFKYKIVWNKKAVTNFLNAKKQPLRQHEDICVFYKKQPYYNPLFSKGEPYFKERKLKDSPKGNYNKYNNTTMDNEGFRYPTDIVTITNSNKKNKTHPTQKPMELADYLINTFSKEGDVVLDNCFGSGTFILSAIKNKRNFIGIELNKEVFRFTGEALDCFDLFKQGYEKMIDEIKTNNIKFLNSNSLNKNTIISVNNKQVNPSLQTQVQTQDDKFYFEDVLNRNINIDDLIKLENIRFIRNQID